MAKLSIIIPLYNMREKLERCLFSVRNTVRIPYEVIVVDDGSSADEQIFTSDAMDHVRLLRSEEHHGYTHAVNEGIRASEGEVLLFLHADVMLAPHTVEDMLDVLIADPNVGAVTAVAPVAYRRAQLIPPNDYLSWDDYVHVAEEIRAQAALPCPEILAEMFALMARRDAVSTAGNLDERYSFPALASYDFTVSMTRAGYGGATLPSTYVHRDGENPDTSSDSYRRECDFFHEKWGVSLDYSFSPRRDLMSLMDFSKAGLRVLEIGCACGVTLREIGARSSSARLYGVELNEKAAEIAAPYATILSMDVERLDPSQVAERFDYIVMGDVIEHLQNPWKAIENMRELLAPGGEVIASIPNIGHISNLYEVLSGNWTYKSMGLLDRTHLRFFTKKEIIKLFQEAQFDIQDMRYITVPYPEIGKQLRKELLSLQTISVDAEDLDAFQWLVRAKRV